MTVHRRGSPGSKPPRPLYFYLIPVRRDTSEPYVNWNIRVLREDKAAFKRRFPMNGAQTWFVEETIRRVLVDVEKSPALRSFCNDQIARMLMQRPGVTEEFSIRLPTALYERFNNFFPQFGAATWLVRNLVLAVSEIMDESSLADHLDQAVQRVLTP